MVHYKLNYFNARGRAEVIRLVFAAADVKYEDFRWEHEQWPAFKTQSPTGQAPFLEVKDDNGRNVTLVQSVSIGRTFFLIYQF